MNRSAAVRTLIKRLARIDAGGVWGEELNPAQRAALEYIEQANRFSRAPSHVAEYLGSTRGTVSQTLKALQRKGYLTEMKSESDRRYVSYDLTQVGREALETKGALAKALAELPTSTLVEAENSLQAALGTAIKQNDLKPFGICKHCKFFERKRGGAHCGLLEVALAKSETAKICHEQQPKD